MLNWWQTGVFVAIAAVMLECLPMYVLLSCCRESPASSAVSDEQPLVGKDAPKQSDVPAAQDPNHSASRK